MPLFTKLGSTYKLVYRAWVKQDGVWKELELVHYKFGNSWRVVHRPILPFIFNDTLTGTVYNYNLRQRALLAGWTPERALIATINLNSCDMLSLVDGAYAFNSGIAFPEGSNLTLNVSANSRIIGKGGRGGRGGGPTNAEPGGAGNPAMFLNIPTFLNNLGTIAGGGGGGGAGGYCYAFDTSNGSSLNAGGFGGAGGAGLGLGGTNGVSFYRTSAGVVFTSTPQGTFNNGFGLYVIQPNRTPISGTVAANGASSASDAGAYSQVTETYQEFSTGDIRASWDIRGGNNGAGGLLGSAGATGALGFDNGGDYGLYTAVFPASIGGVGGKAIVGYSFCTVLSAGTIIGGTD